MKASGGKDTAQRKRENLKKPLVKRAIVFVNLLKPQARALGYEVKQELNALGIHTDELAFTGKKYFPTGAAAEAAEKAVYDVAISLGGDGTVLSTARAVLPLGIPIFPINLGTFGFIAGVNPNEWKEVFLRWLSGKVSVSRRLMLDLTVKRQGKEVLQNSCLNDFVISASGIARLISLQVFCGTTSGKDKNSSFVWLGSYRSDGLIISTPTGSTAYSVATGGPIVDPDLEAVILNPICPFTLSCRPIVRPINDTILVEVGVKQRSSVLLTVDGQVTKKLKGGDKLYITKSPSSCHLIASDSALFYDALKSKLAWAGGEEGGYPHA